MTVCCRNRNQTQITYTYNPNEISDFPLRRKFYRLFSMQRRFSSNKSEEGRGVGGMSTYNPGSIDGKCISSLGSCISNENSMLIKNNEWSGFVLIYFWNFVSTAVADFSSIYIYAFAYCSIDLIFMEMELFECKIILLLLNCILCV